MVFWCCYHRFQWFLMVPDQWSNNAMVSMNRCGLVVTFFLCSISAFAICDNQSKDSKDILFSFTRKMYRILPPSRDTPSLMKCLKLIWLAPTPLFDRIPAHRGRHYRKKLKADRLQYYSNTYWSIGHNVSLSFDCFHWLILLIRARHTLFVPSIFPHSPWGDDFK